MIFVLWQSAFIQENLWLAFSVPFSMKCVRGAGLFCSLTLVGVVDAFPGASGLERD